MDRHLGFTPFTRPFWEALSNGRFVVQRCTACGHRQWTPQFACRRCLSEALVWSEVSGRATVYSVTVVHRSPDPARFPGPYVLAIVQLDEGPHLLTRIVADALHEVAIGDRVKVAFRPGDETDPGPVVYEFEPA